MSFAATLPAPPRPVTLASPALLATAPSQRHPIIPLRCLAVLAQVDDDAALRLIEEGAVLWAWNIASNGAARREIRVLFDDAVACLTERPCQARSFDAVLDSIFPVTAHRVGSVRATTLRHSFCCSQQLIAKHLENGDLMEVGKRPAKESPSVSFPSVRNFLTRRRIT